MLRIDLKIGESVQVGQAVITLEDKPGKMARLAIQAERSIPVRRIGKTTTADIAAKAGIGPMAQPA